MFVDKVWRSRMPGMGGMRESTLLTLAKNAGDVDLTEGRGKAT